VGSFVWMRLLESTAQRYDRGIGLLSGGRMADVYRRIAALTTADAFSPRVLDIGCGTGGVSLACAARGATVVGIDVNAAMLEVAQRKAMRAGAAGPVTWLELGAMEIEDRFGPATFEAVVACLSFSEMTPDEQTYVLEVARTRLRPGGRLVVADEVVPRGTVRRALYGLRRWSLALLVYALTQTTTRPVAELPGRVRAAGFLDVVVERMWGDAFCIVRARAPAGSGRADGAHAAGARGADA
jgi:demethylmenaquinone methyltransferase/2-methoxy-6-polyprenyl-1,4-benzoquinol methylase